MFKSKLLIQITKNHEKSIVKSTKMIKIIGRIKHKTDKRAQILGRIKVFAQIKTIVRAQNQAKNYLFLRLLGAWWANLYQREDHSISLLVHFPENNHYPQGKKLPYQLRG